MGLMLLIHLILKLKLKGQTNNDGIINVETMAPLKYLSNRNKSLCSCSYFINSR